MGSQLATNLLAPSSVPSTAPRRSRLGRYFFGRRALLVVATGAILLPGGIVLPLAMWWHRRIRRSRLPS